ncbi:hypothetical protein SAMN05421810_110153 [Amycolatopsis arida]|uniref:J domain-containing protein n=1 Tax=Amycolatopsis arida TaxID=587909 RepID=A0A1I5ZUY0_9PSEU|nr:hypothetical protein [Amycolatopsis arida]TDX89386.1 hypothetical protein CLV69_110154 [Amycolatopsis arida]SFQ60268.1 hypothetical protein SAMN05421810_110153 [Amycolatopsis arida]
MRGPEERAAFREFVRRHHPDVGGDPEEFVAGLTRFRRDSAAPQSDVDRYDAPVSFVQRAGGVAGMVEVVRRWRRRRREPPRVR